MGYLSQPNMIFLGLSENGGLRPIRNGIGKTRLLYPGIFGFGDVFLLYADHFEEQQRWLWTTHR